jgi:hypothetical protein
VPIEASIVLLPWWLLVVATIVDVILVDVGVVVIAVEVVAVVVCIGVAAVVLDAYSCWWS